ncbi:mandelate racemase/muconate lactonizing enzyme family protein [Peribacillus sp. SCS-155]|uniref:mandelate racemase/muconate lactonizing enzyme family protein n=1 Tax=Peribacillus sedimenti TaxID=3115297 RepID=UPI0039066C0C
MKIEKVETFPLLHKLSKAYGDANGYKKYRSCYLIRIITKSGIDGWGECTDWLPAIHTGFQDRIEPFLIGKPATDRLSLVDTIKKWNRRAASAVSMALTDIAAKYANMSVCQLWGGAYRQSVPVYASFQSYSHSDKWMTESVQHAEKSIIKGFQTIKVKVGGRKFQEDCSHIKFLQKCEGVQLIIDANQSYDMSTARKWNRYLSDWQNILWFEEPIPIDNVTEYQALRSIFDVPISGGENVLSARKFIPLLRQNALDIIQPDIVHMKGIDDFRDALQLARNFGVRVSPHNYDGALPRLYSLFCMACLPPWSKMDGEDIEPMEWDVMENPFTNLISITPHNGRIYLPKGEGIGVKVNMDIVNAYRWDGSLYQA